MNKNQKLGIFVVFLMAFSFTFGSYWARASDAINNAVDESGTQVSGPAYTVFKVGSTYYARNGLTGAIDYQHSSKSTLLGYCVSALGSGNGTILLKDGVSLSPTEAGALTTSNRIHFQYEDGTTIYEEYYYKILVALTSPSLLHFKYGNGWSLTPNQTIYSAFYIFVRYGGLTYNYVDVRSPPNPIYNFKTFNSSDTITPQGTTSSILYVTKASVDLIANAKAIWDKRAYWLATTQPTRLVIESVDEGTPQNLNFTSGTYGSLIKQYIGQGWKISLRFVQGTAGSQTAYQVITNLEVRSGAIGTDDGWSYMNGEIFAPTKDTIDGTAIHWQTYVSAGGESTFTFKAYAIFDKYDLPSWWEVW